MLELIAQGRCRASAAERLEEVTQIPARKGLGSIFWLEAEERPTNFLRSFPAPLCYCSILSV